MYRGIITVNNVNRSNNIKISKINKITGNKVNNT